MKQLLSRIKAILILLNFALSLVGLCVDPAHGPIWASIAGPVWFAGSCVLLIRADKAGTMDKINKQFKIDDL